MASSTIQAQPKSNPPSAPAQGRPAWITLVIVLWLADAAFNLWNMRAGPLAVNVDFALFVLQMSLLIGSAVGLWQMKRWGAVLFAVRFFLYLLVIMPISVFRFPAYLQSGALWCPLVASILIYGLIFRAFVRMSRDGILT